MKVFFNFSLNLIPSFSCILEDFKVKLLDSNLSSSANSEPKYNIYIPKSKLGCRQPETIKGLKIESFVIVKRLIKHSAGFFYSPGIYKGHCTIKMRKQVIFIICSILNVVHTTRQNLHFENQIKVRKVMVV